VIEKYELGPAMLALMTDPKAGIAQLSDVAKSLREQVSAIETAQTSTGTTDKSDPMADKFGKDEVGAAAAVSFLRTDGGVFDRIVGYIDDDPAATFHVLNAVTDLLVKFLRDETNYHRAAMTPKVPKSTEKGNLKADYNDVVKLIGNAANIAAATGYDVASDPNLTIGSTGPKSVLSGYRGAKVTDDGSVTGRYAKVYSLAWNIDGEDLEDGTPIGTIVRYLWSGVDRIGKNAKSVTTLLDKQAEGWTGTTFKTATFTVNDHEVTVSRETED